jgi:hypothetical protein
VDKNASQESMGVLILRTNLREKTKMPHEDKQLNTDPPIEAGPRNKLLETQHLEYLAHAMLDEKSTVAIKYQSKDLIVIVNERRFNLSEILKASPCFDQLEFSQTQLNQYLSSKDALLRPPASGIMNSHAYLHPAEASALRAWSAEWYLSFNALLRNYTINPEEEITDVKAIILGICIASHGLSKPLLTATPGVPCTRGEEYLDHFIKERERAISKNHAVLNRGFTAAARSDKPMCSSWENKPVHTTIAKTELPALNPLGKYIGGLSINPQDYEVLYPPNTEFIYEKKSVFDWSAKPVRSANPAGKKDYKHSYSTMELAAIKLDHLKIQLRYQDVSDLSGNASKTQQVMTLLIDAFEKEVKNLTKRSELIASLRATVDKVSIKNESRIGEQAFISCYNKVQEASEYLKKNNKFWAFFHKPALSRALSQFAQTQRLLYPVDEKKDDETVLSSLPSCSAQNRK